MRYHPLFIASLFGLLLWNGCSSVSSSSVATGPAQGQRVSAEQVSVAATWVPEGAIQVAIVETHGNCNEGMGELIRGFREEVSRSGGNFGKVDSMRTRFEIVQQTRTESYNCGTSQAPQTCTRQVTSNVEVGTTTVLGRSFLTENMQ